MQGMDKNPSEARAQTTHQSSTSSSSSTISLLFLVLDVVDLGAFLGAGLSVLAGARCITISKSTEIGNIQTI